MRKLSPIILLIIVLAFCFSCDKMTDPDVVGSLYGSVADKATGEPVKNAGVELQPTGLSVKTGDDGNFEFIKVEPGTYNLYVTKIGYKEYRTSNIVINGDDRDKPVNILLEKLPPALTILDDSGNTIDTLDFGDYESVVTRSFYIFNNSEYKLSWKIKCIGDWIYFDETEGTIDAGATQPLLVTIEREKLHIGANTVIAHVISNNGNKQLTIVATRRNAIETKEATDINALSAVLHAIVIRDTKPSISEYGFVYSNLPAPSLINGAQKVSKIGTPQIGEYSFRLEGLEREKKYHFCAYIANEKDTIYGEQREFVTISHTPKVEISSINTAGSSITVSYRVSDAGIPLQEVGLCWDTDVLPSKEKKYKKYGEEAKSYTSSITDLLPNTLYYIRAYAQNEEGITYSTERHISTTDGLPTVITSESYTKGTTYLIVEGRATSDNSLPITRKGFCWATEHDPTIYDNVVPYANLNDNPFSCRIENLQPGTTYYIRAFAENQNGPGYGTKREFTTDYEPAKLMGYVYDQSSMPIRGVTIEEYDSYRFSTNTDANGYYEISISIKHNETYKIRAYKENYNEQIKSITLPPGRITQQDFILTANTPSTPEIGSIYTMPDGSFMVQTVDLGSAQWNSAKSLCESSTLGGYTDWRLPTLNELKKIYTYKTQIGGFPSRTVTNNNYWSGSAGSKSGYYYYIDFNTGTSSEIPRVNSFKVRAVRTIK